MGKLLSINLLQRVLVALAGIPLLLWLVHMGGLWFFSFFLLLSLAAMAEFHHLASGKAHPPALWLALLGTILVQLGFFLQDVAVWEVLLMVLLPLLVLELYSRDGSPMLNLGSFLVGFLYVNLSFGALQRLRLEPAGGSGEAMVFLMFIAVWSADIAAYFGGNLMGGRVVHRKLFERHSPNKSWEGFFFGVLGSVAAAYLFWLYVPVLSLSAALLTGLLIGLGSPLGDLVESMFKRDAGVKDSSGIIPGHGGVLDRFDTILFVAPFVYLLTR